MSCVSGVSYPADPPRSAGAGAKLKAVIRPSRSYQAAFETTSSTASVKSGKTHLEHMLSELPPIADIHSADRIGSRLGIYRKGIDSRLPPANARR
jgi:hypothetical protein